MRTGEHNLSFKKRRASAGAGLVEALVACVIIALLALAGSAYIYQSRAGISFQRNKRIAIEAANARLEDIRSSHYSTLASLIPLDYGVYYLRKSGDVWVASASDPSETADIHGTALPLTTTIQYLDIDGGDASFDGLLIVVGAAYRTGLADSVVFRTIYAP